MNVLGGVAKGLRARSGVQAAGFMVLASVLFAVMNLGARVASREADFSQVAAARSVGGAIVAFAFGRWRNSPMRVTHRGAMFARASFGTLAMLATFIVLAERALPLGDAATLFNLSPLGVALLSPVILGERPGRALWLGLIASLFGVLLILKPGFDFGHSRAAAFAALLAVGAALCSSFAMMAVRKLGQDEAPEAIALHFAIFAGIFFGALAAFRWRHVGALSFAMMALAAFSGGIAQIAMTQAYRIERAARVSSLGYLNVVATAIFGSAFLHESTDRLSLVGIALVLGAGVFLAMQSSRASKPPKHSSSTS